MINNWEDDHLERLDELADAISSDQEEVLIKFLENYPPLLIDFPEFIRAKYLKSFVKTAININNPEGIKDIFRNKIKFKSSSKFEFNLNEIAGISSGTLPFGNGKYILLLSSIFHGEEEKKISIIEETIIFLLKSGISDKQKLEKLFNLSGNVDIKDAIFKLEERHSEVGFLENSSQLDLVCLYNKYIDNEYDLSRFSLLNSNVLVPLLLDDVEITFYALDQNIYGLFNHESYLNTTYDSLQDILRLNEDEPRFITNGIQFFLTPIIEGDSFLGPRMKENLSVDEQLELLDFIRKQRLTGKKISIYQGWKSIFGVDPRLMVLSKNRLIPDENIPAHITDWSCNYKDENEKKDKINTLAAIGINTGWSLINKLRNYLLDKSTIEYQNIEDLEFIPPTLIANTFTLLTQNAEIFIINLESHNINLYKQMVFRCLNYNIMTCPLPVLTSTVGKYRLAKFSGDISYYFDNESVKSLSDIDLNINQIIENLDIIVYDATNWPVSNLLKESLNTFIIKTSINVEKIQGMAEEWNERFYLEWKQEYPEFCLFRINFLPVNSYINGFFLKEIELDDYHQIDNSIYIPSKFSIDEILSKLREKDLLTQNSINRLAYLHDNYRQRVQELLNTSVFDYERIEIEMRQIKEKLEKIAEQEEIKKRLSNEKYTYQWFLDFLNLQVLQSSQADTLATEKEITFLSVEMEGSSERIILLKDPSRTITPTLEYCADFNATFYKKTGGVFSVQIQGVSKKGQRVLAILSFPKDIKGVDFRDIKKVELRFSRAIDLLQRLSSALRYLGARKQWQPEFNLKINLPENIQFVYGPPGTGKTTYLANKITKIIKKEPAARVLVLTPTNKAADVITEKIMALTGLDNNWLVRYGITFNDEIIQHNFHYDLNTFNMDNFTQCAFITTIHRFPYEEFIESMKNNELQRIGIKDFLWDYIILDEASMIPINYIAYVLFQREFIKSTTTSFIISGDPLQIPPVIDLPDEFLPDEFLKEENIYTMIGLESFNPQDQKNVPIYGNKILNLKKQYRSIECIGKLFSHFTYKGLLEHGRNNNEGGTPGPRELTGKLASLGIKPITLIRFPVNDEDSIFKPSKLRQSPYHIYTALLLVEIIKYINDGIPQEENNLKIGIICPYRSQATLINKMIETLTLKGNVEVMTDTVHGFQGDECDIVFFLINPPSSKIFPSSKGAFIHKHYLINVGISRARDYLVILYPDDKTPGLENLEKIRFNHPNSIESIIKRELSINIQDITIKSEDVEEILFNDKQHIANSIFTNQHQLVNVYHIAQKQYIIRESTTAIDVQITDIQYV